MFWFAQFVGPQVRVLDHYERQGQPISAHLLWMRENAYTPGRLATIWLPHDGDTHDRVIDVSFRSAFEQAGYHVEVVPNQGRGAAMSRIKAAQRMFSACWFNGRRRSQGWMRSAGITRSATKSAMWAWGRSTTGHLTPRTLSDCRRLSMSRGSSKAGQLAGGSREIDADLRWLSDASPSM